MAGARGQHGRSRGCFQLVLLLSAASFVQGTHFRYGTISWRPDMQLLTDTNENYWKAGLCSYESRAGMQCPVEFTFKAAYRRNYDWGRFFREQWKAPDGEWEDAGSCYEDNSCQQGSEDLQRFGPDAYQNFDIIDDFPKDDATQSPDQRLITYLGGKIKYQDYIGYQIRLATGMAYDKLVQVTAADGRIMSDTSVMCESAFDNGDMPDCGDDNLDGTLLPTGLRDPLTGDAVVYEPTYRNYLYYPNGTQRPQAEIDQLEAGGVAPCEMSENPAADYCAPWAQTYGFFFGDGENTDIVLTITKVDGTERLTGNYIEGVSNFKYMYDNAKLKEDKPWTAFFTGGNRLTQKPDRGSGYLRNNHNGRFRLEVTVNLNFGTLDSAGIIDRNSAPSAIARPVLPVPYTGRGMESAYGMAATFQVAAFDADISPKAYEGATDEANEPVYYFIGGPRKHGMLLSNQVPEHKYPSNWFENYYEEARMECYITSCGGEATDWDDWDGVTYPAACGTCTQPCAQVQLDSNNTGELTMENAYFSCEEYPPWNNDVHLAHAPPNAVVDVHTGQVRWETGTNPYSRDTAAYLDDWTTFDELGNSVPYEVDGVPASSGYTPPAVNQLEWGFYNFVFDIRSVSHDKACKVEEGGTELLADCSDLTQRDAREIAYVSVPLDMLVFLYPPASFCSKSKCGTSYPQDADYADHPGGTQTFRDINGLYGFPVDAQESGNANSGDGDERFMSVDDYIAYEYFESFEQQLNDGDNPDWNPTVADADRAVGTGKCTICAGGVTVENFANDTLRCVTAQKDFCGYGSEESLMANAADVCVMNTLPTWVDQEDGDDDLTLYTPPLAEDEDGQKDFAEVFGRRGDDVTFNLVATDADECVELEITDLGLYKGYDMYKVTAAGELLNENVCTFDESYSSTNNHVDVTCGYDMRLSPHLWMKERLIKKDSTKTFFRRFEWWARKLRTDVNVDQALDPRPPNVMVCFEPFDFYQLGKKRCVNIVLTDDKKLYWVDERPRLWTENPEVFGASQPSTSNLYPWLDPYTPVDGTTFYVAPGNTLKFTMSAAQRTNYGPLSIYITQGGTINEDGEYDVFEGASFDYIPGARPTATTAVKDRDPAIKEFVWTPKEGQQCEYVICFMAMNTRDDPAFIDYATTFADEEDQRCYTIHVMDQALSFESGSYVNAPDALPSLTAECGMSFGTWLRPRKATPGGTMSLVTFGYHATGLSAAAGTIIGQLKWEEPAARLTFNDGFSDGGIGSGVTYYRAVFSAPEDGLEIATDAIFCNDEWHFVMVTIDSLGAVMLYVDGVQNTHFSSDTRDFHAAAVVAGTLPLRLDGKVGVIGQVLAETDNVHGFLAIGSSPVNDGSDLMFDGLMTDFRIYSRALSASEIQDKMFIGLDNETETGLEAYYKFNDGDQTLSQPLMGNADGGYNKYSITETPPGSGFGDTTGNGTADSPFINVTEANGPSQFEMPAKGTAMMDSSGLGRHATGCDAGTECTGSSEMYFVWEPSPVTTPCPKELSPRLVHVDGGETVTISGAGFAPSQWLKCSFSGVAGGETKVVPGTWINSYKISCQNPGADALTAAIVEVTNNGDEYSFQKIPLYELEQALSLSGGASSVKVQIHESSCAAIAHGMTVGGWVYPKEAAQPTSVMTLASDAGYIQIRYTDDSRFLAVEQSADVDMPEVVLGTSAEAPAGMSGAAGAGWHHVVLTGSDDAGYTLFVDGEATALTPPSVQLSDSCELVLGGPFDFRGGTTGQAFKGLLEEVSLWSKPLTACNAYALMWGNLTRNEICPYGTSLQTAWNDELVVYLKMNDKISPNTATDSSGNGRHGVVAGGSTSFVDTAVPFLAPSFNRNKPRMWPKSVKEDVLQIGSTTLTESLSYPRMFMHFYGDAVFPGNETAPVYTSDDLTMTLDGFSGLKMLGFGFAESKWLRCAFNGGTLTAATYVSVDTVRCEVPAVECPGDYSLGVSNLFPSMPGCAAEVGVRSGSHGEAAQPLIGLMRSTLTMKENTLKLDGISEYAVNAQVAAHVMNLDHDAWTGVTFGAWFKPNATADSAKLMPVACFATNCGEGVSDRNYLPSKNDPNPGYGQLCAMYRNGMVYLFSNLRSSEYELFANDTAARAVEPGEWHYVEVTVGESLILEPEFTIPEDSFEESGYMDTFPALMLVDNVPVVSTIAGKDIRVALDLEAFKNATFYVGALGCPGLDNSMELFQGEIDEVRVLRGYKQATNWFSPLAAPQEMPGLVAYYRLGNSRMRDSHFLYTSSPVTPVVDDLGPNALHLSFANYVPVTNAYELANWLNTPTTQPTYEYTAVPWQPAVTMTTDLEAVTLAAGDTLTLTGLNMAKSQWLQCVFTAPKLSATKEVEFKSTTVNGTYISDTKMTCEVPAGDMPAFADVQAAVPRACNDAASLVYLESALELQGDMVMHMDVIGGYVESGQTLELTCPAGMRMDKVLFANYGRPANVCNYDTDLSCDMTEIPVPCDYLGFEVNNECSSDVGKSPLFTLDILSKACYGHNSCSVPASNELFGEPCERRMWLAAAMRCSDRWATKDYVQQDDLSDELFDAGGSYSIGLWVFPYSKPGVQAVAAFGANPNVEPLTNLGVLQWRGDEGGQIGTFYYYDDCVLDAVPLYGEGRDLVVASHQWHQVWLTRDTDGESHIYVDGILSSTFTSSCSPQEGGTFILGMDLNDEKYPTEFFAGMLDEVKVYNYSITQRMVRDMMAWAEPPTEGLIMYWRFNKESGTLAWDEVGVMHGHLASSTFSVWDPDARDFVHPDTHTHTVTAEPEVHTSYIAAGSPWFPTSTEAVTAPGGTEGPLMGGTQVTLSGVNFAKGSARVFYDGVAIQSEYVDSYTMTAIIPNLKDNTTTGGVYPLTVSNTLDFNATISEEGVEWTQSVGLRDLHDGLLCHFPLLGDATDHSGHSFHGLVHGATLAPNRRAFPDQAMEFGAGDTVAVPDCSGGQSVAMWVYYADAPFPDVHYKAQPWLTYEAETGCQAAPSATRNNAWKHIVGSVDDTGAVSMLFVNGVTSDITGYHSLILAVLVDKELGGRGFAGVLDDVWVWDRTLNAAEAEHLFAAQDFSIEFGHGTQMSVQLAGEGTPGFGVQGSRGLLARYFADGDEHAEVLETLEATYSPIPPERTISSPFPSTSNITSNYAVQLTGYIYVASGGEYTFTMTADDHFQLWLNKGQFTTEEAVSEPLAAVAGSDWVAVITESCPTGICTTRARNGVITLEAGWYEIYASYRDGGGVAGWKLEWESSDGLVPRQIIPKEVLRSGTGPLTVEAWVHPYEVNGDYTIASQALADGYSGWAVGITQGGLSASMYTGCDCRVTLLDAPRAKCDKYRQLVSWKAVVRAGVWQHIYASYDGTGWKLYVDGALMDHNTLAMTDAEQRYPVVRFFPESTTPIVLGRDGATEGSPVGLPAEGRPYLGLLHSFAMWAKPPAAGPEMQCTSRMLASAEAEELLLYLPLSEGAGIRATTMTSHGPMGVYADATIVTAPAPLPTWVMAPSNCSAYDTDATMTRIEGTALEQAIAGQCAVFTIASYDTCGTMRGVGGDAYTATIEGPLHLHTSVSSLAVDDGIVDQGDGSYTATFERTVSGFYMITVSLDNTTVQQFKTYIHPNVLDPTMSFLHDDIDDALPANEVRETMAGVPVQIIMQGVDKFGNLKTEGGMEEWVVHFEGPYAFDGVVEDNHDGSYNISYTAMVAGTYQMSVRVRDTLEPVCTYGGATCAARYQSEYAFCTTGLHPVDPDGLCRICVEVKDGGSASFKGAASMPVVFPSSDALNLEVTPFTLAAFVKKSEASGEDREYILQKQSSVSGKGYWLALISTGADTYDLEAGLYVGGDLFRVVRNSTGALLPDVWTHLAATYSGTHFVLYVNAEEVGSMDFATEAPVWNKPNTQPLKVGANFMGYVDNVLIMRGVRGEEQLVPDSYCPMNMPMNPAEGMLVAYLRMNEQSGIMTLDSSPNAATGTMGLICKSVDVGQTLALTCATGYHISHVLYANFGDNDGVCGAYEAGSCGSDVTDSPQVQDCIGNSICHINVTVAMFPLECASPAPTLAINAVCTPDDDSTGWSSPADPAPTLVGVTTVMPEDFFCPYDLLSETTGLGGEDPAVPPAMRASLEAMMPHSQCGGVDMLQEATTGRPVVMALKAKDGCGYRSVDPSATILSGGLVYPSVPGVSEQATHPQCPDFAPAGPADLPFTVQPGAVSGWDCSTWRDLYLLTLTPVAADPNANLTLRLNDQPLFEDNDLVPTLLNLPVNVSPAVISAASTVEGSATVGAEAGVEGRLRVTARDTDGNQLITFGDASAIGVELLEVGGATPAPIPKVRVVDGPQPGVYDVFITYPMDGTFHLRVTVNGVAVHDGEVTVTPTVAHAMSALGIDTPAARSEATMVAHEDSLFVFGGVLADKTYTDTTLKLDMADGAHDTAAFSYKRLVSIHDMPATDFNVELTIDTAALIAGGKMQEDCADMRLLDIAGLPIAFWVEPSASPSGCGTAATSVWIKVPGGVDEFWLYYGNKHAEAVSDPAAVFGDLFEDFEYADLTEHGWTADHTAVDTCQPAQDVSSSENSFHTSDVVSMTGSRSLRADSVSTTGGALVKSLPTMTRFTLKAFVYDMMCSGTHFVSPDFSSCEAIAGSKGILPQRTGAGINSAATEDAYCVLSPWHSSPGRRSVGWHSFTMRDDDTHLMVSVDAGSADNGHPMPLRRDNLTTDLSQIYLHAMRAVESADLASSSVFWDSILVTEYNPDVVCEAGVEQPVVYSPTAMWSPVGTTNAPPARRSHTALGYNGGMWVFGGERSGYEYSDVWRYDFSSDSWTFQSPSVNVHVALARRHHTAVVHGDAMYVYGGRSGSTAKADFWQYEFATSTWTAMPTHSAMPARFGHVAAVAEGKMYVFGGYVLADDAGLSSDATVWEYDFAAMTWSKLIPRVDNTADVLGSPLFPQSMPTARFAAAGAATGSSTGLYVVGGASASMETEYTFWKLDLATKAWTLLETSELVGRYDAASTLSTDGGRLVIYGGLRGGEFLDDVVVLFVGDAGL